MKKALLTLFIASACASTGAASITGLGFLPGHSASSRALAISGDGNVVVGYCETDFNSLQGRHAFRWSSDTGMEDIHQAVGELGFDSSEPYALSSDGSVIVGQSDFIAFRWKRAEGMVALGDLDGGSTISAGRAITSDSSIIYGNGYNANGFRAVKWTAPNVIIPLENLDLIQGCSSNGAIAIGSGPGPNGTTAVRWQDGASSLALGDFSSCGGDLRGGNGLAISRDGKVLIGVAYPKGGSCVFYDEAFDAFRWTAERGLEQLERPNGFGGSRPEAISADGALIGGSSRINDESVGYLWNQFGRAWKASDVLSAQGADISHWKSILSINGVSDNGLALAGIGLNIDGKEEAFLAHLDAIDLFGFSSAQITGNSVTLSWPKDYATLKPQAKAALSDTSWSAVTENISLDGDFYVVTLPLTNDTMLFRLAR
jgi:probable HAF family extracellular repeat protein